MGEAQPVELRERGEEVPGQPVEGRRPLVVARAHLPAEVVDGVVAAPHDAVVGREPVVVELVGRVADALPIGPADRGQLGALSGSVAST